MSLNPYTAFLPPSKRPIADQPPVSTWWDWHGHRVHLARAPRPQASHRVLVVHGAGGHSGALWPIAALLADRGLDVAVVDLPLYGRTSCPDPGAVRYDDWVRLLVDLIDAQDDGRPLVVVGASLGGMLAYEAAAHAGQVAHVVATCLLDPRDWRVRAKLTRFGPAGILATPLSALARGRIATTMVAMRAVAKFSQMSRDPELSAYCARDPLGGGAKVPVGFLASYMRYRHVAPEHMTTPVTLTHPGRDEWTPPELSLRWLARIAAPTHVIMLEACGHFPIEEPGMTALVDAVATIAG